MKSFNEIALNTNIKQAVEELGFTEPTPIQSKVIPHLLTTDRDLIALAQTGTGKTAAFGLPIIQQINLQNNVTQALVICPTRELCIQIANDVQSYSKYIDGLRILAVYGGSKIETQINKLQRGVHLIIGTPGRMLDLINRRYLKVDNVKWLVLDEADEMLTMGFKEELNGILEGTPREKQTMLFSATMPEQIRAITKKYMQKPEEISVGRKNQGAENVKNLFYMVHADDRYEALKRIADFNPNIYGIVFCRTRKEAKTIADRLIVDGYNADALHGDLSQAQRDIVMNRFREEHLQLLVATDVAARGLDVNNLTHIINYNLPEDPDIYLHRSGRTGRAGKSGTSISIVHARAGKHIKDLEQKIGKPFSHMMVPDGLQVCEKRLFNLIDKIHEVDVDEEQIKPFMEDINEKFESLSKEEIIKKFVWVEFNRFLSYYKDSTDLNISQKSDHDGREKGSRKTRREAEFARFYINIGNNHNLTAQRLMGIVNEKMQSSKVLFGKIEIMKKFSFFEIDMEFTNEVLHSFDREKYKGEELIVELVKKPKTQERRKEKSDRGFYDNNNFRSGKSKRGERADTGRKKKDKKGKKSSKR